MPTRKHPEPDEKVGLTLTATERNLILDDGLHLEPEHEQIIRNTPAHEPAWLTLDDWTAIVCSLMIEADRTSDTAQNTKLRRVIAKINKFLDRYPDDLGPELKVFPAADDEVATKSTER